MFNEETWNSIEWLDSARNIVKWLDTASSGNIIILLRHSHRERLNDHEEMMGAGLTELGKETAREMGRRIPLESEVRLLTSFISRCYETAEYLVEGFSEQGHIVGEIDPLSVLVGPENAMDVVSRELDPDGVNVTEFVNRWAAGEFDDDMESFTSYLGRLQRDVFGTLPSAHTESIRINITHDLTLMATKRALHGSLIDQSNREPYLGGIAVIAEDSDAKVFLAREKRVMNKDATNLFGL